MKRIPVPARIIVIVYLVIAFFMLVNPPSLLTNPRNLPAKPTKESLSYVALWGTDYGALFANILTLSVVAAFALAMESLLSHKHKGKEGVKLDD